VTAFASFAALLGFGLTVLLIRFLAPRADRLGLVDRPGEGRKDHAVSTPNVGGLAIVFGLALTTLFTGNSHHVHPAFWLGLLIILLTGTVDDLVDLNPYIKFLAQIAAAVVMSYWGGLTLQSLGNLVSDRPLVLDRFALLLTFFAVIGVINAINLADGADGLAGGLVFIALLWLAFPCAISGNADMLTLTLGLLGCTAAFLVFNMRSPWRKRAAVFLGNGGSLSLGFTLAWLTIAATQAEDRMFPAVTAIWLLAIPISDTIVCMSRRLMRGHNPFRADRTHLHHILIDLGLAPGRAVALVHLIALVLAGTGIAGWALRVPEYVMFYTAMAVFAVYILLVQYGLRRASRARLNDLV